MVKQAIDTWGRLDIVVSNAGILRDRALHNLPEEDWAEGAGRPPERAATTSSTTPGRRSGSSTTAAWC